MTYYTVFMREKNSLGTTYITGGEYPDAEAAKAASIEDCLRDWRDAYTADHLHILGESLFDVKVIEWEDPYE